MTGNKLTFTTLAAFAECCAILTREGIAFTASQGADEYSGQFTITITGF